MAARHAWWGPGPWSKATRAVAAAALFSLLWEPAAAGTLCGTIRDAQTQTGVGEAGVFLRLQDGSYTGLHGATDAGGAFCIPSVPPGTYDVEVRRDDYRIGYLRGVVVTGSTTDVEVTIADEIGLAPPWPNPATRQTRLRWTLSAAGAARLSIHDLQGRTVRAWWSPRLASGTHSVVWDLTDASGITVSSGLYLIRLETGSARVVRRLAVVR